MPQRIRTVRHPAVLAAGLAAAPIPAAADDSHEVALQLQAPAAFHTYDADEGADIPLDASPALPSQNPSLWAAGAVVVTVLVAVFRHRRRASRASGRCRPSRFPALAMIT